MTLLTLNLLIFIPSLFLLPPSLLENGHRYRSQAKLFPVHCEHDSIPLICANGHFCFSFLEGGSAFNIVFRLKALLFSCLNSSAGSLCYTTYADNSKAIKPIMAMADRYHGNFSFLPFFFPTLQPLQLPLWLF